jgi:2-polyprenyl-3-methyl-5-hydroxy-6-metoxy-1,4-benzoquinol methylase
MPLLAERYWDFTAFKRSAPHPSYIEIRPNWREVLPDSIGASGRLIRGALLSAESVLDVGGGNRYYAEVFKNLGLECRYASVDTDVTTKHDYADFLAVSSKFDAIVMFEVLEHLPLDLGIQFLAHARALLNKSGVLLVSTPNAHHPNHVWRIEVTHVRPWPAPDLYGVLKLVGFESVELVRQYCVSRRRSIVRPITKALFSLMELDYAQTILAICR